MVEETRFLKESELFKGLPDSLIQKVYDDGLLRTYGPGEFIFREGETSFQFYIIRNGVVEIQITRKEAKQNAIVAYLSRGECFGEMALITGRPRLASVRVPQAAEVLEIPAEKYEELIEGNIIFVRRLCEILAFRLENADRQISGGEQGTRKELQGSLHFFDLATVMQTLINTGQSGIMLIETPEGIRAEVAFAKGNIVTARMGRLEGEDAFYEIFHEDIAGEFTFRGENVSQQDVTAPIDRPPMNLLLEAMRLKDESKVILQEIEDFDRVFEPCCNTLRWPEEDTLDSALMVWMKVSERAPLRKILEEVPRCSYAVLAILKTMLERGLVR